MTEDDKKKMDTYWRHGYQTRADEENEMMEKLVEGLRGIDCLALGGLDYTSTKKFHEMRSNLSQKIAKEALADFQKFKAERG